jgi:uncharacterized protein (DUF433 family)
MVWWNLNGAHAAPGGFMDWHERVIIDPEILAGKPVIKGTRLAVPFLVSLVAQGWTREEIVKNYPQLTDDDVSAALKYAAEVLNEQRVYPLTV